MTAAKMLTGRDMPLGNMEMALTNTYHKVLKRFQQQQGKTGTGTRRRR